MFNIAITFQNHALRSIAAPWSFSDVRQTVFLISQTLEEIMFCLYFLRFALQTFWLFLWVKCIFDDIASRFRQWLGWQFIGGPEFTLAALRLWTRCPGLKPCQFDTESQDATRDLQEIPKFTDFQACTKIMLDPPFCGQSSCRDLPLRLLNDWFNLKLAWSKPRTSYGSARAGQTLRMRT